MPAIEITSTVEIDHAQLGTEAWDWDGDQQAAFLANFATAISANPGVGIMQIAYVTDEIRKNRYNLDAVRWLNNILTEYLAPDERAQ